MEYEISLNNLIFYSFHGVYEEERITGNEFRVNLKITIPGKNQESDELSTTVSYADLYNIVEEEMRIPRKLLETVVYEISKKIKEKFHNVSSGRISIEKLHPPIPGMIGSASVALVF